MQICLMNDVVPAQPGRIEAKSLACSRLDLDEGTVAESGAVEPDRLTTSTCAHLDGIVDHGGARYPWRAGELVG